MSAGRCGLQAFEIRRFKDYINGNTQAVQVPLPEWERGLNKLKKYEQALKLKSDLKKAFDQVAVRN